MSARLNRVAAPVVVAAVLAMVMGAVGHPQAQGRGGRGGRGFGGPVAPPGRAGAPVDLTGTWVSVVTEDWEWRMITPKKGDASSVPLNGAGTAAANSWDPSQDGKCEAYGVGGIMRMPTRLKISWQDDLTLKIESDAGQQTRLLHFAPQGQNLATAAAQTPRTLQGYSVAEWERGTAAFDAFMGGNASANNNSWGSLKVTTTNMLPGWLRRNGVPYSQNATVSETFMRIAHPEAGDWFVVRTVVDDPTYLRTTFITSSNFKKEPNDSKWSPAPCKTS